MTDTTTPSTAHEASFPRRLPGEPTPTVAYAAHVAALRYAHALKVGTCLCDLCRPPLRSRMVVIYQRIFGGIRPLCDEHDTAEERADYTSVLHGYGWSVWECVACVRDYDAEVERARVDAWVARVAPYGIVVDYTGRPLRAADRSEIGFVVSDDDGAPRRVVRRDGSLRFGALRRAMRAEDAR